MDSQSYKSLEINFTEKKFPEFEVEFAEKGDDFVYHFFPKQGDNVFDKEFGVQLESEIKKLLPETADVRADYMSLEEAQLICRFNDEKQEKPPTESFYVCVKNGTNNPMVDYMLKDKIFRLLQGEINGD